ncbi:hypothetical protein PTSG_10986 [Salpingoeca rosetta]|uniref:Fe2OG dioxygenase domain-containing protein n=1 Tax=Salpingoeca rosetta (strain ATCC 50818 / BSB-021) TaxID=946362 RepID=F2USD5_SALR5|nr:uncharacterized protein PTSG_10986 [Salpingoeca rosetta]EGD81044.1 hypothetical protein PTSG_10986 [Salpingoeca rosetta]|eukprot:XP_004987914.1 hypothetical protein PTSG_10986 [Salpingoeca rosetta]
MVSTNAVSGVLMVGTLAAFLAASTTLRDTPFSGTASTQHQQPFKPGEWGYADADWLRQHYNITMLSEDPPVIQFNNFISQERIDAILHFAKPKFARSTSGIEREVSNYRTSSTAWMLPDVLGNDPMQAHLKDMEEEIARIVRLPVENQEHFQVLQYQKNQYYKVHSDYIEEQRQQPCGIRVATFFLYLNDVEEGGGTRFPNLNLTVQPAKGNAVLWYSAYPNTTRMDSRTDHEAMPVAKGMKYGANKWIHIHDFVTPWANGKTV